MHIRLEMTKERISELDMSVKSTRIKCKKKKKMKKQNMTSKNDRTILKTAI